MLNEEIIIKRLALIKYLYKMGLEQSKQVETLASFSILSFHDSIEMFLKLISEHRDQNSEKAAFLAYWEYFPELTLKESMRNLNARRTNIKHKGLLPSKSDIEISRVTTTEFFEQNVFTFCNVNFHDISLLTLIHFDSVRTLLEEAQKSLSLNKFDDCIENSAIAFAELLHSYENSKTGHWGSPFFFGHDLWASKHMDVGEDREMEQFVRNVVESIEGIQKAIKIISFGIDYKRYAKFKLLTPIVFRTAGGRYHSQIMEKKKWTIENCQYCIDFVLDCALKLQEFDFDLEELVEKINFTLPLLEDDTEISK